MARRQKDSSHSLIVLSIVALVLAAGFWFFQSWKTSTDLRARAGNAAPSGPHYNLNIIGVPKGKVPDLTNDSGRRMFVPLYGQCKINLAEGDFAVLDGNCTNDGVAAFQLPNPDPNNDGYTAYSVYARALGKPGGSSKMTTCATDPITGELWCSVYSVVFSRTKGQQQFVNVSRDLLYIYVDLNGDGTPERYNLFSDSLRDYFWNYDNNGMKLVQLRFYQISSMVQ